MSDVEDVEILKEEARRAEEARRVLQSEAFLGAFDSIRADLQSQMSAVKATDDVSKCKLIDAWKTVDAVERYFVKTIETGEAAVLQLNERKVYEFWK